MTGGLARGRGLRVGNAGESLALDGFLFAEDSVVRRVSAEGALLLGGAGRS